MPANGAARAACAETVVARTWRAMIAMDRLGLCAVCLRGMTTKIRHPGRREAAIRDPVTFRRARLDCVSKSLGRLAPSSALALRAIGQADVRFGILPSQSAFAGMTTG